MNTKNFIISVVIIVVVFVGAYFIIENNSNYKAPAQTNDYVIPEGGDVQTSAPSETLDPNAVNLTDTVESTTPEPSTNPNPTPEPVTQ